MVSLDGAKQTTSPEVRDLHVLGLGHGPESLQADFTFQLKLALRVLQLKREKDSTYCSELLKSESGTPIKINMEDLWRSNSSEIRNKAMNDWTGVEKDESVLTNSKIFRNYINDNPGKEFDFLINSPEKLDQVLKEIGISSEIAEAETIH